MSFFSLKQGELNRIAEAGWPEEVNEEWLAEQLARRGGFLPERLLVIGGLNAAGDDSGNDTKGAAGSAAPVSGSRGLFALDSDANLVFILLYSRPPEAGEIKQAGALAWDARHIDYPELERMAQDFMLKRGVDSESLGRLHRQFFEREKELRPARFNESQRLVILAPNYSQAAINAIFTARLESRIDAYQLRFIELDSGEQVVSVERLNTQPKFKLSSLFLSGAAQAVEQGKGASSEAEPAKSEDQQVNGLTGLPGALLKIESLPRAAIYGILAALIALYVATFSYLSISTHNNFGTFGFDLGIFDQGLWLLSRQETPFVTVRGLHLFGDHLSFILVLLAPLYKVLPDVRMLLFLQTLFLALGALPVFLIANRHLKSNLLSLALAASYLLYPALQWINNDHFHPDSAVTALLLFAFYFATSSRYLPFAVSAALAVLVKEDVALVVMLLGVYIAATENRRVGVITSVLSLAWFALGLKYILPHFNGDGFFYINNYSRLGATPAEVIKNTLTRPGMLVAILLETKKLSYLTQLLAPVLFLPIISLEVFLVALPALFSNLVSQQGYMDSIQYHYTATIIPFLFVAMILSLGKLGLKRQARPTLAVAILVVALFANYMLSPSPLSVNFTRQYWTLSNERAGAIRAALDKIPADAAVSAHFKMVPHLTHRQSIYEFPNPFKTANWGIRGEKPHDPKKIEYVAVDLQNLTQDERLLILELRNNSFKQVFREQDILVLKRR